MVNYAASSGASKQATRRQSNCQRTISKSVSQKSSRRSFKQIRTHSQIDEEKLIVGSAKLLLLCSASQIAVKKIDLSFIIYQTAPILFIIRDTEVLQIQHYRLLHHTCKNCAGLHTPPVVCRCREHIVVSFGRWYWSIRTVNRLRW